MKHLKPSTYKYELNISWKGEVPENPKHKNRNKKGIFLLKKMKRSLDKRHK